ncbi:oxidoreductase [Kroppenstedtia pulmonis]|uniref:Oxidoreductase n=1 Tax=Kroppenstedtia pulmonis TaxID=1380685 RepID=A0A7D4CGG3_9BACL|nr:oxidoreductase [Kroppenstedtia pulmonis]QKG84974.1 oxidoreductase [Kroppenstedtia pulmonis]
MSNKSALLAGAGGLVGSRLLTHLLESGAYHQVSILVRRPLPVHHPRLEQYSIDFDRLSEEINHINATDVFCCLGTTMKKAKKRETFRKVDYTYPLSLAKQAKSNGCQRFLVVTALGSNPRSPFFYNQVKGDLEEALKKMGLPSLSIFQPSLLLGQREEFRLGESAAALLMRLFSFSFIGPLTKYKAIPAETVARAMFLAAQENHTGVQVYESHHIRQLASRSI